MRFKTSLTWLILVAATAVACKAPDEADPNAGDTTNIGGTTVPVGTVTDSAGFAVGLVGARTNGYYLHNATDTTSFTSACKVNQGTAIASSDITCLIEAAELDLWFNGLSFVYNVPSTMCTYVTFSPYYFFFAEPGTGPVAVEYFIGSDGKMGIDTNDDGVIDTENAVNYVTNASTGNGINQATASLEAGKVRCGFSYFSANCCDGDYNLRVQTWVDTEYKASNAALSWGGKWGNCLAGAAIATQPLGQSGFPESLIYLVDGTGMNQTYTVPSSSNKRYGTNLLTANYFDPLDHGAPAVPAGHVLNTTLPAGSLYTQPYYEIRCLDEAMEIQARIRIMVREWNLYSEWLKKGTGNPEVTGFEPNPYGTEPIQDINDWGVYGTAYPGTR